MGRKFHERIVSNLAEISIFTYMIIIVSLMIILMITSTALSPLADATGVLWKGAFGPGSWAVSYGYCFGTIPRTAF